MMANKNSWKLSPLFQSDDDPQINIVRKEVKKVSYDFINKWKDRNDYLSDPVILKQALDEYENWAKNFGPYNREVFYFSLRTSQDQLDSKLKAKYNQIIELARKIENDIQFFILRIAKIKLEDQPHFLAHSDLQDYRHFLEKLFEGAKHQLSDPEEKIITLKTKTSHDNWVKMTGSFLSKEERQGKTLPGLMSLLFSQKKSIRDAAAVAINDILEKYVDVAENEINSVLANKKVDDELRHFPRPDSASHLEDDFDTKVVDTMIQTVSKRFDISARWYTLKSKLLGLPRLAYHERLVEYGKIAKDYPYDEAEALVKKVFINLDPEFGQIYTQFIKNNQIDVYPQKGKHDGAFCAPGTPNLPTYVLLNHTDTLNDVRTIAHEFGHAINSVLSKKSQNALNFDNPLSTAEVASTFVEDFVLSEMAQGTDDETRLAIMVKKLDDEVATIYRQSACYLFEQELHQEFRQLGYLDKDAIGKIFQKHMASYMGPSVEQSPGSQNWWVYWGHIRSFFYVYTYVSGLLISKSLQASVKQDPTFIVKIKSFLSAGSSASPKQLFADLGIDITDPNFWLRGITETENLLNQIEALAQKLGKI